MEEQVMKVDPIGIQVQNALRDIQQNPNLEAIYKIVDAIARECYDAGLTKKRKELTHQLRTSNRHLRNAERQLTKIYSYSLLPRDRIVLIEDRLDQIGEENQDAS